MIGLLTIMTAINRHCRNILTREGKLDYGVDWEVEKNRSSFSTNPSIGQRMPGPMNKNSLSIITYTTIGYVGLENIIRNSLRHWICQKIKHS